MDLERYDVPVLAPGERRRLDPADEALLQVRRTVQGWGKLHACIRGCH